MTPLDEAGSAVTDWHAQFADRRRDYRAGSDERGRIWIIRRKTQGRDLDVLLRTPTPPSAMPPDDEAALRDLWWRTAWPGLTPKARKRLMRESLRSGQ